MIEMYASWQLIVYAYYVTDILTYGDLNALWFGAAASTDSYLEKHRTAGGPLSNQNNTLTNKLPHNVGGCVIFNPIYQN